MKFTKIPSTTFQKIQLNAGVLLDSFDPSSETVSSESIIGATSGGNAFEATPSYEDFGSDIDNCPKNTKELKKLTEWEIKMSGTFVTADTNIAKRLIAAADIDGTDSTKVIPRVDIKQEDFADIWWVGDYSNENNETSGGYIAIHMMNSLSTGGFKIQSGDKTKGTFDYEFTAHFSISDQSTVPFEVYIKAGEAESLAAITVVSTAGSSSGKTKLTLSGYTQGSGETYYYKTNASEAPSISYGDSVDNTWTSWNGTADITATNGHKITVASVGASGAVAAGDTTVVSAT